MCKVAPRVLIGDPRAGPSVFVFFFFFPDSFLFTKKNKSLFFNNVKLENVFLFLKNPTGGDKEKCGLKRKICSALLNRTVEGIYRFFLLLTRGREPVVPVSVKVPVNLWKRHLRYCQQPNGSRY